MVTINIRKVAVNLAKATQAKMGTQGFDDGSVHLFMSGFETETEGVMLTLHLNHEQIGELRELLGGADERR